MNKEIYCTELRGECLCADKFGVIGTFAFKDSMTQKEMLKTKNADRLFLVDKDYKQALIDIRKLVENADCCTWDNTAHEDILQIIDKTIGDEKDD